MTNMKVLNDAEVLTNLKHMYESKHAYCQCGATLVAMNLNEAVKGVYEPQTLQSYIKEVWHPAFHIKDFCSILVSVLTNHTHACLSLSLLQHIREP